MRRESHMTQMSRWGGSVLEGQSLLKWTTEESAHLKGTQSHFGLGGLQTNLSSVHFGSELLAFWGEF